MNTPRCPICGKSAYGQPSHTLDMARLADALAQNAENESQRYMRYGYRCADGHTWDEHQLPSEVAR